MGGAPIFLGAKKNGVVRVYETYTHEDADLWPWTLAARNFEAIADVGIAQLAAQLLKIKDGDEATGMLEEAIEEWLDDVKSNARGERLPLHGGKLAEPLPAGMIIDADEMVVDVFRPHARPSDSLPGPQPPSATLKGLTLPDGSPAYTHVLRAREADLNEWGERLERVLDPKTEHVGPDGLECWEHAYLAEGRDDVLEHPDRLKALLAARALEKEQRREELFAAVRAGERERVAKLFSLGLAPANEIMDLALEHGHDVIAADCLEGADVDTLTQATVSALEKGRGGLARALLGRGGAKLIKRVERECHGAERFVPFVEQLVALKKKVPEIPGRTDWWPLELVERLARALPSAAPLVERTRAYHAEEARKRELQVRLGAAIRANDAALVKQLLDDGASAGTQIDGEYPVAMAVESASADVVRLVATASAYWGHEDSLARAIERGPAILGALLVHDYARSHFLKRLLSTPADKALALYRLGREAGWVPPDNFLGNFTSKGPIPPLAEAVLAEFPERRSAPAVAVALERDAFVKAIGPECTWNYLGTTLSLWWNGRMAAWVIGDDVYLNVEHDAALAQDVRASGAGQGWRDRDDFLRIPVAATDPAGLRPWLARIT